MITFNWIGTSKSTQVSGGDLQPFACKGKCRWWILPPRVFLIQRNWFSQAILRKTLSIINSPILVSKTLEQRSKMNDGRGLFYNLLKVHILVYLDIHKFLLKGRLFFIIAFINCLMTNFYFRDSPVVSKRMSDGICLIGVRQPIAWEKVP